MRLRATPTRDANAPQRTPEVWLARLTSITEWMVSESGFDECSLSSVVDVRRAHSGRSATVITAPLPAIWGTLNRLRAATDLRSVQPYHGVLPEARPPGSLPHSPIWFWPLVTAILSSNGSLRRSPAARRSIGRGVVWGRGHRLRPRVATAERVRCIPALGVPRSAVHPPLFQARRRSDRSDPVCSTQGTASPSPRLQETHQENEASHLAEVPPTSPESECGGPSLQHFTKRVILRAPRNRWSGTLRSGIGISGSALWEDEGP